VDKEEATAFGIMEALVCAFSADNPMSSREGRALQIGRILDAMVKEKRRPVLVIDEAHALNYRTLRALKRLYDETEFGFRRSLAILLVGQNSNKEKSYNLEDKLGNWDLREVSERCQLMRLGGLGSELGDYLRWKFEKAGRTREIVTADALHVLSSALKGRKGEPDMDAPLVVNNIVSVAMTLAHDVGKDTINAELMSEAIKAASSSM
jgi:type II secretory pathway predicted ATPase ExeA